MGYCVEKVQEVAMCMSGGRLVQPEQNGPGRGHSCASSYGRAVPEFLECLWMRPLWLEQSEQRGK